MIKLSDEVWNHKRFRESNPDYQLGKPFVYVGMTGHDPDTRFDQHKAGYKSNSYVTRYGERLMPSLYEQFNSMPFDVAVLMEVELARRLRGRGYGVWQA